MNQSLIYNLTPTELSAWLSKQGHKTFRTKQVLQWLYQKGVSSFDEMSDLSKDMRQQLLDSFTLTIPEPVSQQFAEKDETEKVLFQFHDNEGVETVKMPRYSNKVTTNPQTGEINTREKANAFTLCLSSQAGCMFACKFCASGQRGLERHLSCGEIISQVMHFVRQGVPVTRIVFMGTGEPLHNLVGVKNAIEILTNKDGLGLSPRSITISTVGIVPEIYRIAKEQWKTKLAISLHATTDEARLKLIPVAKEYQLDQLMDALAYYHNVNGRRITFEYLMMQDVNDTKADAKRLTRFCERFPVLVNLIPYNNVSRTPFHPTSSKRIHEFQTILRSSGIDATVRYSRGRSIDAACGQLRLRHSDGD